MDVSIGSIVEVMQSFTTTQGDGETVFVKADERFVVLDFMGGNAEIRSLRRSLEMVVSERFLSRYFLEVQPKVKERKPLSKANLNTTSIQQGQVVKVQKIGLEDAQKWATDNGYHIELNVDERFIVKEKRTKTVFIESKDRDWTMYLPKRFLEEATDECAALDAWQPRALIDVALDTGDEEWFDELYSKLSTLD